MSSVSTENLKYVVENIEFEEMEVSDMDGALLMALLDESNEEEAEDERLGSVMKSLEAEISTTTHDDPNMILGTSPSSSSISIEDYRLEDVEFEEGQEDSSISSGSPSHADNFDWINDMEIMDSSLVDTLASDDDHEMGMINCSWYMDNFSDEIETEMIEFGDLKDYNSQFCYEYNNSLWQEPY